MRDQKLVETSLIYRTERKQNRICQKTVSSQSPLCQSVKREDIWWEGFVKEVGFELGWKSELVMNDESGEFMEKAEFVCVGSS